MGNDKKNIKQKKELYFAVFFEKEAKKDHVQCRMVVWKEANKKISNAQVVVLGNLAVAYSEKTSGPGL